MKKLAMAFVRDETGLTMVEYAVAGGLVVVGAALAFTNLGNAIIAQINALIAAM
jgi:pilus assembly protein Flp/PilA